MELSFESVNRDIESIDFEKLKGIATQKETAALSGICEIWQKVGGIIRLIASLPLLPKKWREALNVLIAALDSLCQPV